jgi:hypothetical protein
MFLPSPPLLDAGRFVVVIDFFRIEREQKDSIGVYVGENAKEMMTWQPNE